MVSTDHKFGMPLKLWIWSFAIAVVAIVSLLKILEYRTKHLLVQSKELKHYIINQNPSNSQIDCHFVGSSLTFCALSNNFDLDSIIVKRNLKLNCKVSIIGSSKLSDFNKLIHEIRNERPKHLFIESKIACINDVSNFRGRLVLIPQNFYKIMKEKYSFGNIFSFTDSIKTDNSNTNNQNFHRETGLLNGAMFDVFKIDEFKEWNNFFGEAKELGICVHLLELPRSIEAEKLMFSTITEQYNSLVKQYFTQFKIDYIDFPNKISREKYYLDRAHFNKNGSKYYSNWLLNELENRKILNSN